MSTTDKRPSRKLKAPRPLSAREAAVLRAAPIGVDVVDHNGDPERTPNYRYQSVNGRLARGLWTRGLLVYRPTNPLDRNTGGLLHRTPAADQQLAALDATARVA